MTTKQKTVAKKLRANGIAAERYDIRRRRIEAAIQMKSVMAEMSELANFASAPAPKWSRSTQAFVKRYAG